MKGLRSLLMTTSRAQDSLLLFRAGEMFRFRAALASIRRRAPSGAVLPMTPTAFEPAEAGQHRCQRERDGERRHEKRRKPVPRAVRIEQPQAGVHGKRRNGGG